MSDTCSAGALAWFGFVGTVAYLSLPWWLLEIPHLLAQSCPVSDNSTPEAPEWRQTWMSNPSYHKPGRGRLARFAYAVSWNCFRCLQPGYCASFTVLSDLDHRTWFGRYYFGYGIEDPANLSLWHWAKIILTDIPPFAIQSVLLYLGATDFGKNSMAQPGWWLWCLIPQSITGLYLFAISTRQHAPTLGAMLLLGLAVHAIVGTAVAVTISFAHYSTPEPYKSQALVALVVAFSWCLTLIPWAIWEDPMRMVSMASTWLALARLAVVVEISSENEDAPFGCIRDGKRLCLAWVIFQFVGVHFPAHFPAMRCENMSPTVEGYMEMLERWNHKRREEEEVAFLVETNRQRHQLDILSDTSGDENPATGEHVGMAMGK